MRDWLGLLPALAQWNRKELWNVVAVAWAAMLLAGALILEYGFSLAPCALCLTQRWFVLLAGLFVVAGLAHDPRLRSYPLLGALASVAGAYFSIRHLYLLTLPPDTLPGCGVDFDYVLQVFPAMDILRAMTQGTGDCAEQSPVIPALALLGFVGLATFTVMQYFRR